VSFQSSTLPEFWKSYESLPANVQVLADAEFALFQVGPFHPSLALKQKGQVRTADIERSYRAIAYREGNDVHWFWIGTHEAYNNLLPRVTRILARTFQSCIPIVTLKGSTAYARLAGRTRPGTRNAGELFGHVSGTGVSNRVSCVTASGGPENHAADSRGYSGSRNSDQAIS
jgi:hypothetical protein